MFDSVDPVLLIAGLARVFVWGAIAIIGYQQRRVLPLAFGTLAVFTSSIFAIANAHGEVPKLLTDASTFLALPISVLILIGVMVTRPTLPAPRAKRWHL